MPKEEMIMLMNSIFGNNVWDDFVDNFAYPVFNSAANTIPTKMKTDIKEVENGYELDIELPGFKKEDVSADLKDGYLTIKAAVKEEKEEKTKFVRRERYYSSCQRSYYVGEYVDETDIKAKFEDGILKIFVPKKEAKQIEEKKSITIE